MILGTFQFGSEIQEVVVDGNQLYFVQNGTITTIEGVSIKKSGVIKEFPDLADKEDWKRQAIDRLKNHIKTMKNEMDSMNYIKTELTKQGYKPLFMQKAGFRPQKFQENK